MHGLRSEAVKGAEGVESCSPSIHIQGKQTIRAAVEDFEYEFNKTGIVCMMNEDGFGVYDWSDLFTASKRMVRG